MVRVELNKRVTTIVCVFLRKTPTKTIKSLEPLEIQTRRERPKSAPYLRLKNIQGTTIVKIWKKNFSKKLFLKFFFEKKVFFKSQNAEKLKKRPFRLIQRFLQTENFKKKCKGVPFDKFQKFSKKVA